MAFSARPTSTDGLTKLVNMPGHLFTVGTLLRFNGVTYVRAQADSEVDAELIGIVSIVPDVDNFYITQIGYVNNLSGLIPGIYYLSATNPGQLAILKPSSVGEIVLPCLIADSATSGYFFASVGQPVSSGGVLNWSVVGVNTPMAVNNGYFTNSALNINMLLPPVPSVGDIFRIAQYGIGSFTITQNAGDSQVLIGGSPSTIGVGGSVVSLDQYSAITGVCVVAGVGSTWFLMDVVGNFDVF